MSKIDNYAHFVCIVAGDNPEELMKPYDSKIEVPPYVVYKYEDAEKIRQNMITTYEAALKNDQLGEFEREDMEENLSYMKTASAHDVFYDLTIDYDKDETTGDAISRQNPDGKWRLYDIGKFFSLPFKLNNGEEAFQANKEDINWPLIHNFGRKIYERAWEMVMENSEPTDDQERNIYENMKNRTAYFRKFGNKETYVASNTAFWGYAFLSKETGWVELEDNIDQFEWMINFYDKFIDKLPENTKLTIIECTK